MNLTVACMLIAAVCTVASARAGVAPDNAARLRTDLETLRQQHNIPLLGVSFVKDAAAVQSIVLGGSEFVPLRWGSITKTFTALTVLGLHEAGRVALDAPASRYVDDSLWQNPWRATAPTRVIDLLELRAGLTDLSGLEFNHNTPLSLAAALQLNPGYRITRWPPGLQHGYSNMTPGLTQVLIEKVSGLTYAAAVQEYVFRPLRMQDAGFEPRIDLPGGFRADGVTPIPYWHMTFAAFGAMNAPLKDLNRVLAAAVARDALPPSVWDYLFQPHGRRLAEDFEFDYAAGFYPRVRNGHVWHGHGGDADGYRARIAVMRNHPRGYVANINTDNPAALKKIEALLETFLTSDLPAPAPPARAAIAAADLRALTGQYYPASARFDVDAWRAGQRSSAAVTLHDGNLVFTRGNTSTPLFAVTPTQFRRAGDPVATVVFDSTTGHTYLQGELGNFARTDACPEFLRAVPHCTGRTAAPASRPGKEGNQQLSSQTISRAAATTTH